MWGNFGALDKQRLYLNISCVLPHLSTVESLKPFFFFTARLSWYCFSAFNWDSICCNCFSSPYFLVLPFSFIQTCMHSQKAKDSNTVNAQQANLRKALSGPNKRELCLPELHSGETAVSAFSVLMADRHNWTQLYSLGLNLPETHSHTYSKTATTQEHTLFFSSSFCGFFFFFTSLFFWSYVFAL